MNLSNVIIKFNQNEKYYWGLRIRIKKSKLSKTDKYWLDQVDFRIEDKNLNIHVRSEFIKSSIEKKLYEKIKDSYKKVTGFDDCIFILDKKMKIPDSEIFFEDKSSPRYLPIQ